MFISQVHTHIHSLFNTRDNIEATADRDTSCSSVRYLHIYTLSLILVIIQTPRQTEIHHVHQSGTHTYSLFNTHDNTDATADGDTSCSSVRYTHIYTLSLILVIIQTPRQTEIHHVHQSGTHTYSLFNTHDNTDATADGDTSCSSVRYTHIYTLFLILMIIQTPRQMEISCSSVRYIMFISQVHTHTLSL